MAGSPSITSVSAGERSSASALPFVSVIVPCRNEQRYIARCLDSLLSSDYPEDHLEFLIVDGRSEDDTRAIVNDYARRRPCIRLLDNPSRSIPAAMNTGIRAARGDIVIKMDAHSIFDSRHISLCVRYLLDWGPQGAENVGGTWHMNPGADTLVARAIVSALGTRFGSGNALIKMGVTKPTWSDSVAFGCYRKEFLERVGGFDERLLGSSDMDLNRRIRAAGGRILIVPEVVVEYFADPTFRSFWKHNVADGVWTTYVLKFGTRAFSWRHWIPLAFVLAVLGSALFALRWHGLAWLLVAVLGAYAAAAIIVSLRLFWSQRSPKLLMVLPAVFAVRHVAHGVGALFGCLLLCLPGVHWKGRRGARA